MPDDQTNEYAELLRTLDGLGHTSCDTNLERVIRERDAARLETHDLREHVANVVSQRDRYFADAKGLASTLERARAELRDALADAERRREELRLTKRQLESVSRGGNVYRYAVGELLPPLEPLEPLEADEPEALDEGALFALVDDERAEYLDLILKARGLVTEAVYMGEKKGATLRKLDELLPPEEVITGDAERRRENLKRNPDLEADRGGTISPPALLEVTYTPESGGVPITYRWFDLPGTVLPDEVRAAVKSGALVRRVGVTS